MKLSLSVSLSLAFLAACAAAPEEAGETKSSATSAETNCVACALRHDGHVVIENIANVEQLEQIVRNFPNGGWEANNSYYLKLDDGRFYYKSWLYLIQVSFGQLDGDTIHPRRGRIVGYRSRAEVSWQFADRLDAAPSSTLVVLGTWEDEAKNALSMKWIPSEMQIGSVVLPSKQTFADNFFLGTQPVAYAGLISCANKLKSESAKPGYGEVSAFETLDECKDAKEDRDRVLGLYRDEAGQDPTLIVGISAGTLVAQQLGEKLGGVETHLFGTPRYACKGGNPVACHDGDIYAARDAEEPYCENGPVLFANGFYHNNPHDRVPGSFFDNLAVAPGFIPGGGDSPWHDYSNWAYVGFSGADRFQRTEYLPCNYPVAKGGPPKCAEYAFDFATCIAR